MQSAESSLNSVEPIPPRGLEILVSVTTPALLGGLLLQWQLQNWCEALGEASETLFRGEELPILPAQPVPEQNVPG